MSEQRPSAKMVEGFVVTTVVVANGELADPSSAQDWLRRADRIIAADGGSQHCFQLGFTPHLLIGDLDSVADGEISAIERAGGEIERHPRRKEATDLELALERAHQLDETDVVVLAAIGGRWDQSLINLLLLAHPKFSDMRIRLTDGPQVAELIHPGRAHRLAGEPGDLVSLIPLGGNAQGVTSEGLEYPLRAESLRFSSSRGISNVISHSPAQVRVEEGHLLALTIRHPRGTET